MVTLRVISFEFNLQFGLITVLTTCSLASYIFVSELNLGLPVYGSRFVNGCPFESRKNAYNPAENP
jgi:hypothetical protein